MFWKRPYVYYLYIILLSQKDQRTYVGHCVDMAVRLNQHNSGKVAATRHRRPLEVFHTEQVETLAEAKKRELYWKSGGGRRRLKKLFTNRLKK